MITKTSRVSILKAPALPLLGLLLGLAGFEAAATGPNNDKGNARNVQLISQSALLLGLDASSVFPFIDVTPNRIRRAHIAVTDATDDCGGPGTGMPASVQVLVGVAGGTLVPVLTDATNTGISTNPGQCVFHVTVRAGKDGVPAPITDIVVLNGGPLPLTGVNTITVSAEVVLGKSGGGHTH